MADYPWEPGFVHGSDTSEAAAHGTRTTVRDYLQILTRLKQLAGTPDVGSTDDAVELWQASLGQEGLHQSV